jgi:hypothetical protein
MVCVALACTGWLSAAIASQADALASIGVTGYAATPAPSFSGATWQDGVVNPISAPPGVFAYSADVPASTNAALNLALAVSVAPAPQQPPVPLLASVSSLADLGGGRLGVTAGTGNTSVVDSDGSVSTAFTVARVGAAFGLGLDLVMPWSGDPAPTVPVTLRLTLNGTVLDLPNDADITLRSTLRLSNVAFGPKEAVNDFSTSIASKAISLSGDLVSPTCSTTYGVCAWSFALYASIEGVGQISLGPSSIEGIAAGDGLDFSDGASIQLLVPAGARVTDGISGTTYRWVTAVPEPSGAVLMAVGLVGLGLVRWNRRPIACQNAA